MSVERVTITAAEEKYAPPDQEIDVAFADGRVFITVFKGSDQNVPSTRERKFEVPSVFLEDLLAALSAVVGPANTFIFQALPTSEERR